MGFLQVKNKKAPAVWHVSVRPAPRKKCNRTRPAASEM